MQKLTGQHIGQLWIHHTGHNEQQSYGTKTREWQLDTVALLERVELPAADIAFKFRFTKARERTPDNRADFDDVRVALVGNRWQCDAVETQRAGHVSPLGLKFLDALNNVLAGADAITHHGRKAAPTGPWRAECTLLGLIDPEGQTPRARPPCSTSTVANSSARTASPAKGTCHGRCEHGFHRHRKPSGNH